MSGKGPPPDAAAPGEVLFTADQIRERVRANADRPSIRFSLSAAESSPSAIPDGGRSIRGGPLPGAVPGGQPRLRLRLELPRRDRAGRPARDAPRRARRGRGADRPPHRVFSWTPAALIALHQTGTFAIAGSKTCAPASSSTRPPAGSSTSAPTIPASRSKTAS